MGTVAVAHSSDLRRWQQDEPLRVPDWFEWLEVPEVHYIDGTWYLLFVTRRRWVTARGTAALRAQGLDAQDGAYYMMASSWRAASETIRSLSEQLPRRLYDSSAPALSHRALALVPRREGQGRACNIRAAATSPLHRGTGWWPVGDNLATSGQGRALYDLSFDRPGALLGH